MPGGGSEDYVRDSGDKPAKSFARVGTKTAETYTYAGSCTSGRRFTVTQHWLPVSHIRVTDMVGVSRTSEILASFRFGGG